MKYRRLGKSGLKVSEVGLGCDSETFTGRADEQTAIKIINHALDLGVTFIDTAETYSYGRSEELIGKAVKGRRSQVVIATKFGASRSVGPSEQRGSRVHLMKAVEGSLKRLGTDYIDLYLMHEPDPETPIEETLRTLDDLVRMGKVRYIGGTECPAWQISEAVWTSRANNLESFVMAGGRYNMIDRNLEREFVPCCLALGIGIVQTEPLAGGFLTGKYHRGQEMPAGTRFTSEPALGGPRSEYRRRFASTVLTDANFDKLEKLEAFAQERGHKVGDLALAWLLSHPWLGSVIPGATNIEQITQNVAAADWVLTTEEIAQVNKIL